MFMRSLCNFLKNTSAAPEKRPRERGNVLFFILITVALFAALSFVVSQMIRSGGSADQVSAQKLQLFAGEVLSYGRSLREGAQKMRINGCTPLDISFENPLLPDYAHDPSVADSCKMFEAAGGGVVYIRPPEDWLDTKLSAKPALYGQWFFPANVCVPGVGSNNGETPCSTDGEDNEDIIAVMPYIRKELCMAINKALGIKTDDGQPPAEDGDGWQQDDLKFTGSLTDGAQLDQGGLMSGCFAGSGVSTPPGNSYHFFQVLLPR